VARLFSIAAICLLISASAFAQVAPGEELAVGPRRTPPPMTAPQTAASPSPGADDGVMLQFPNSDVADVLRYYEQLTGKKMIMDNNVVGKVNIFIPKPVTREEGIRIIEMNLLLNGYSLVPAEGDIVKVIGTGKNPRTAGVPIISDEADIPEGDHVISYLFKLRYADPQELQQVLGQYLSPPQPYTSFLALPKSSSILVTENSSVIRTLVKIIDQVDVAPAEVESQFIKLERADATKVVDMLKDIFEKGNQGGTTTQGYPAGTARGVRPVQPQQPQVVQPEADVGALIGLSEESVIVGKIKIAADVRTNRIHVITRPINMPFVRKLIAEFDANVEFAKPVTRPLRYISAADVLPVLVQSLTEPGENQQGAEAAGGPNRNPQPQNLQRSSTTASSNPYNSSDTSGGGGSTLNVSEELSTQPVDTTPKAVTVGNAKIIADQRANAIIILGNREVVVKVEKILDEMDVSSPQVALSTVIGSLQLDNEEDFGVDYFARHNKRLAATTNFTGIPPAVSGGTLVPNSSPPAFTGGTIFTPGALGTFTQLASNAANGTNIYLAAGNSLAAIVHALNTTGRFKTISRPTVYTSNNKKAIIASGQEIPIPVNTYSAPTTTVGVTTGTAFANSSSVEYKKVALQLEVVPLINSEKYVSLDILQKVDALGNNTIVNGNSIPNIVTRYIKTNVSAPNGSTIILGGLIEDQKRTDTSGLPILSRLPVVGALFRNTTKTKSRSELIVLMRPEVTLTPFDVARLRNKTEDRTHFGPELESDDCPDCPRSSTDDKQVSPAFDDSQRLPPPDLPPTSGK
jgi:type II secretion system protein D